MKWVISMMMSAILFVISFVVVMYASMIAQSFPVALTFILLIIGMSCVTMMIHELLFQGKTVRKYRKQVRRGVRNGKK